MSKGLEEIEGEEIIFVITFGLRYNQEQVCSCMFRAATSFWEAYRLQILSFFFMRGDMKFNYLFKMLIIR